MSDKFTFLGGYNGHKEAETPHAPIWLDLPSEDVLRVVVPQIDLGRTANGNTLRLAII